MTEVRIAMPGFSETLQSQDGDTVGTLVERAAKARDAHLPRNAMFFLDGERVSQETPTNGAESATITVASRARNG
jgi:hypothetical protein